MYGLPMARQPRVDVGGEFYHVHNRANAKTLLFKSESDYRRFEALLIDSLTETGVACVAYVVMPNHWHLLLKTVNDGDMGRCMRALTQSHAQHMHIKNNTIGTGHVYQGRYKSHLVDTERYFLTVLKYIERNPVRAGLCESVVDWKWGSGFHRLTSSVRARYLDANLPLDLPLDYRTWLSDPSSNIDLDSLRIMLGVSKKK